jgi:Tfp pilus assembly protein PilN
MATIQRLKEANAVHLASADASFSEWMKAQATIQRLEEEKGEQSQLHDYYRKLFEAEEAQVTALQSERDRLEEHGAGMARTIDELRSQLSALKYQGQDS